jgi:hypothetical protein
VKPIRFQSHRSQIKPTHKTDFCVNLHAQVKERSFVRRVFKERRMAHVISQSHAPLSQRFYYRRKNDIVINKKNFVLAVIWWKVQQLSLSAIKVTASLMRRNESTRRKLMFYTKVKSAIALVILLTGVGLAPAPISVARAGDNNRTPDLPSPLCSSLEVPSGNRLVYHAYAVGVQIYRWNGTTWDFVEPVATLFADAEYHDKVGIHYLGPTWESNNGGKVVATRLAACSPDATAIPWLLLQTLSTDGPGIFRSVTYIQRVNTAGGLAPTAPGISVGAVAEVPYSAEYYFYRSRN